MDRAAWMIYEAHPFSFHSVCFATAKLIAKDSITCVKAGLIANDYSVAYGVSSNVKKKL